MEEATSSLWLTDYVRLESMLRLPGGTYQLRIIPNIVPAVIGWYLKRTNYGGRNQSGLVTPGNGQKSPVAPPSKESNQEAKTTKDLFVLAVNFDVELGSFEFSFVFKIFI